MNVRQAPLPSPTLKINSLIVIGIAVIVFALYIWVFVNELVSPTRQFLLAVFGAIVVAPGAAAVGYLVFRSVFRRSARTTTAVTRIYFVGSAFFLFGWIANVGEAIANNQPMSTLFLVCFSPIMLTVAAYGTYCGVLSLNWGRRLRAFNATMTDTATNERSGSASGSADERG